VAAWLKRRGFLQVEAVLFVAGSTGLIFAMADRISLLTAHEAANRAARGEILLIDIRSPKEWRKTGIGAYAVPLSMHEPGFMDALARRVGKNHSRQIALICARGRRSRLMTLRLAAAGYRDVYDVSEGMLGSSAGPGWIAQGLAMKRYPGPTRNQISNSNEHKSKTVTLTKRKMP